MGIGVVLRIPKVQNVPAQLMSQPNILQTQSLLVILQTLHDLTIGFRVWGLCPRHKVDRVMQDR